MLGERFEGFVDKSPISVMLRATLERTLGNQTLDRWYDDTAQTQYTRTLLFSTVYELMSEVVFGTKHLAERYRGRRRRVGPRFNLIAGLYNHGLTLRPE